MTPLAKFESRGEEPTDRLGRIAAAMLQTAESHPEYHEGDQVIIMLDGDGRGMLAHGGYGEGDDAEAFTNMLGHMDAIAQAQGIHLNFIPVHEPPGQG